MKISLLLMLVFMSNAVFALAPNSGDKTIKSYISGTQYINIATTDTEHQLSPGVKGTIQDPRLVSGIVTDDEGNPLPGVTVQIKGDTRGTITDTKGFYAIRIENDSDVLVFSFIGYKTVEIRVNNETTLNVMLEEDLLEIDEVVVTALGITKKAKSLVYATEKVDAEGLKEIKDPNNILNSLQGKVTNALITQSSGGVGSSARIVLRGNNSIQGSNSALIVVDGVPIYNTTFDNGANNLNPDDIASVTVLRGPSAAALYGSQAGNGVVLITTNRGTKDKFTVEVNNGLTFERPFVLPDFQNLYGQGNNGSIASNVGDSWGALMEGQDYVNYLGDSAQYSPQPDNVSDFFNDGINLNTSVSVSGGNERNQVYFSLGNTETQGIIPNNRLSRNGFTLRGSSAVTEKLSLDAKITYFNQNIDYMPRTGEGNTPVLDIYQIPRNVSTELAMQYEIEDALGVPTPNEWPSTVSSVYGNPYWVVNNDRRQETRDQLMGFATLKYSIFDWLNVSGRFNLERSFRKNATSTKQGTLLYGQSAGGTYILSNSIYTQKWFDVMFDGQNAIGEKISVNYQAGAIYRDTKNESYTAEAVGLTVTNKFNLNFATDPQVNQGGSQIQIQSLFGTANFSYDNFLFIEGSIRNDWDSRLPEPHAFQYYSAGISGIITEMVNFPDAIPYLKVNFNYAEVGNGGQFGLLYPYYVYGTGTGIGDLRRSTTYPFPDLKPEIVRSLESSIDAKFLDNRLGMVATFYKSNSFNQLLLINIPVGTGYTSKYINAGNIQNMGIELTLTGSPIRQENIKWDIGINYSMNRNEVISLTEELDKINEGVISFGGLNELSVGGAYGDLASYRWATNENGEYIVSSSGAPITTNTLGDIPEVIGNFNPRGIFGLNSTFSIKRITLNALVTGRIGGIMISGTEMNLAFSGITSATEQYRDGGWNLGGVDSDGNPVDSEINAQRYWQTVSSKRFGIGEFFAYDVTNARLKQVSVGYDLPVSSTGFIKRATISLVANNLLWIYRGESLLDVPGMEKRKFWFDPDVSTYNGNYQGVEYGSFPSTRSLGYNLSITF